LFINQFPDVKADAAAGKRNLVVRFGPARARWLYPAIAAFAYAWLVGAVLAGALPAFALVALTAAFPAFSATRVLVRSALRPAALDPAIRATIGAALLHGALLATALFLSR
jgi:1,4-dihydroxy-2-naphthoate octaprenyltransferase